MAKAETTRLTLVIIGGLVVGLGGAAAYVFGVQPRQGRAEARTQIAAWEARWTAAQPCLWGASRRAEDPLDAMRIARFDAEPRPRDCGTRIGKLSRPEGNATGVDEIEARWTALEARARELAQAYGLGARGGDPAPVARAAAALDSAADDLRRSADVALSPRGPRVEIEALHPTAVALPGMKPDGVATVRVRAGAVMIALRDGEATDEIVLRGPGAVTARRVAPDSARALPGGAWAALIDEDDDGRRPLRAGAVGDDGEVGADGVLVAPDASAPLVALGDRGDRLIVDDGLRVHRSRDGGRTWSATAIKGGDLVIVEPDAVAAAADVWWRIGRGWRWVRLTADGALPPPVELAVMPDATCAAGGARWYAVDGRVVRAGAGAAARGDELALAQASAVLACDDQDALVRAGAGLYLCDRSCKFILGHLPEDAGQGALEGKAAALVIGHDEMAAIWRAGAPVRFVRFPDKTQLLAPMLWGGALSLVVWGPAGLGVATVR